MCVSCPFSNKSQIYLNGQGGEDSLIWTWHGFRRRAVFVAGPKYYGNLD